MKGRGLQKAVQLDGGAVKARRAMWFRPHRDGGLLFNSRSGQLYSLSPAGAACWTAFAAGQSAGGATPNVQAALELDLDIAGEIAEQTFQTFRDLQSQAAQPWRSSASAVDSSKADEDPPEEVLTDHFQFEGKVLDLRFTLAAPLEHFQQLQDLLRPLECREQAGSDLAKSPTELRLVATADGLALLRDGTPIAKGIKPEELVTRLEGHLATAALRATDHVLTLHSAVLAPPASSRKGVLIAGPSGRGKSTVSLALAAAGWELGSDDLCVLTRQGMIMPLPFDPCVKSGSLALVAPLFPEVVRATPFDRFGREARYLRVSKSASPDLRVGDVIFPCYTAGAENVLSPLPSWEGLPRLLAECPSVAADFGRADVERLARWHEELKYWTLPYSDARVAAALILDLRN